MKLHSLALTLAGCVWTSCPASAADSILLTDAVVHTVTGDTLAPGQVLIKGDRIAAVEAAFAGKADRTMSLAGLHLYPGLIAPNTSLGLVEISGVRSTRDMAEVGAYHPEVESWLAVNPDSELLPVARANGICYFQPTPAGGIVSGQSALMACAGWTAEDMTLKKSVALHVFWPSMNINPSPRGGGGEGRGRGGGRGQSMEDQTKERRMRMKALEDFFDESEAYARARGAAQPGASPAPDFQPAYEAMIPVIKGQVPVMVHADDVRQIKAAVKWASSKGLRLVIAGGRDAWMAAGLLATNQVPVIYDRIYNLGDASGATVSRDDFAYDAQFRAPAVLQQAGVTVIFGMGLGSDGAENARNLPYQAAQAVAYGLPEAEAIKGLTLYPAQAYGVADKAGSIETGKLATLIALSGPLLDIKSHVKHMWIAGQEVDLTSRHTRLYDKYRARPKK